MSRVGRLPRLSKAAGSVALAAALAASLAACGDGSSGSAAEKGSAAGFPRTVKHAMGEAEIKDPPKRVAALDQSYVDATMALDTPVAAYTTFTAEHAGLLRYLGPRANQYGKDATPVGTLDAPKIEKIISLKPDLILSAKVRHEQAYKQLSSAAPTVFSDTTGAVYKDNLRLTGRALGKERLAEQRIKEYETRARAIGAAIRKKNGGRMPTVTVARFAGEASMRLYTERSFIGTIMKDVGLPRPQGQPTGKDINVDVGPERILDLDADHIFVATYGTSAGRQQKARFAGNPLWGKLKGAKHDVDDDTWIASVGILGAGGVLDELARTFGVDPARTS